MVLSGLDESCYEDIWNAPAGNEYAVQFRRKDEKEWNYMDFALSKTTALNIMASSMGNLAFGTTYRVVRLSRYPPCSVQEIIKFHVES